MPHSTQPVLSFARHRLFTGLATAALIAASAAQAQTTPEIHLAAGTLENALLSLSAQTHQQVLFPPELVAGRKAAALNGAYTAEQAIHLLAPGIEVTRAGPGVLVLRAAKAAPAANTEPVAQGPFVASASEPPPSDTPVPTLRATAPPAQTTVSEIEVTGSNIRGVTTASPLLVISRQDLERSGQTTVADALRTLPQNFGGGASDANTLTGADTVGRNSAFGSAINLRGLGNSATLVLVNGRRLAGSGAFGDFADVSNIPTAAVERVEVLLDGASAVYGSDAVGGVVNIIMKKTFEGQEARVLGGAGRGGAPAQAEISDTLGKRWSNGGVLFSYELQQRDALKMSDRDFTRSADLRPFGGSDFRQTTSFPGNILVTDPVTHGLVPGFAIPAGQNGLGLTPSSFQAGTVNRQEPHVGEDLLPNQSLNSAYFAADQDVGDRLSLSADLRFSERRYKANIAPVVSTFSVGRNNPFFVAPNGAASETIAYSFANQLPDPVSSGSVETLGLTLGGTYRLFGDWRSEGYLSYAQEHEDIRGFGFVNSLILGEALGNTADNPATPYTASRDGFFNPFTGVVGANNSTVLRAIGSGATVVRSRDEVYSANLQADGTVWQLPGGPLKLAIGAQARRETLLRRGFNLLSTAAPVAIATTDQGRNVSAAFAEAQIPLVGPDNALPGVERLDLSVAGRVEHYQSFGTTSNPRIGIVWSPVHDLELRATYAQSFRAPALREVGDSETLSTLLLSQGGAQVRSLLLTGGNPSLRPETANSWTAGIDYKPAQLPGLRLGLTGFDIAFRNRIDRPALSNLTTALSDPTLTSFVQHISPTTSAADLALITKVLASAPLSTVTGVFQPTDFGAIVDARYVNTTTLRVQGLDATGSYSLDVKGDQLTFAGNASYLFKYDQQLTPSSGTVDRVNLANFPVRFRGRATADWTRGRLTLGGAFNYTGAYHDLFGVRIGAQPTVDVQARLAPADSGPMKGLTVLFNVRNVFDRDPPFYNNPQGFAYDPSNADPIGRFVSIQLTRAW